MGATVAFIHTFTIYIVLLRFRPKNHDRTFIVAKGHSPFETIFRGDIQVIRLSATSATSSENISMPSFPSRYLIKSDLCMFNWYIQKAYERVGRKGCGINYTSMV